MLEDGECVNGSRPPVGVVVFAGVAEVAFSESDWYGGTYSVYSSPFVSGVYGDWAASE